MDKFQKLVFIFGIIALFIPKSIHAFDINSQVVNKDYLFKPQTQLCFQNSGECTSKGNSSLSFVTGRDDGIRRYLSYMQFFYADGTDIYLKPGQYAEFSISMISVDDTSNAGVQMERFDNNVNGGLSVLSAKLEGYPYFNGKNPADTREVSTNSYALNYIVYNAHEQAVKFYIDGNRILNFTALTTPTGGTVTYYFSINYLAIYTPVQQVDSDTLNDNQKAEQESRKKEQSQADDAKADDYKPDTSQGEGVVSAIGDVFADPSGGSCDFGPFTFFNNKITIPGGSVCLSPLPDWMRIAGLVLSTAVLVPLVWHTVHRIISFVTSIQEDM